MMILGIDASRLRLALAAALIAIGLAACQTTGVVTSESVAPDNAGASPEPQSAGPADVTSNDPLRLGLQHFERGNYGLAGRYFRAAVEKSPKDADAWIALAASYDQIRRFDLADRAYRTAIRLSGETAQILNNQGYSYLLRGDLRAARAKFRMARQRDPNNQTITNNIQILNSQERAHRPTKGARR